MADPVVILSASIPVAFLAGSIPFGLFIARRHGINIREHGSGNIGATNVMRVVGKKPGAVCFVLDVAKGLIPTLAAGSIAGVSGVLKMDPLIAWLWLAVMAASVLGHMFSPWVGFRGGKGVATGLGSLLGVWPVLTVAGVGALGLWLIFAGLTRLVGLASCIAAASLVGWASWIYSSGDLSPLDEGLPMVVVTGLLGVLVVVKHKGNLQRTLAGTEPRIGDPKPPASG